MKYLILAKKTSEGVPGDDSGDIQKYFELGWESVGSRFDFIAMLNKGEVDTQNLTIVTLEDRMFMYTKFYDNVISYKQFLEMDIPKEDVLADWPANHMSFNFVKHPHQHFSFVEQGTGKYFRHEQDGELIFNGFDLEGTIDPDGEFITICIRHRDWCKDRNSDVSFYQKIVDGLKDHYPIYVAGRGNEEFCEKNNIEYVARLKDYVSLIKNKKCKSLITQSTGLAVLALTCAETDIHFVDHSDVSNLEGDNAISGGKPCHFYTKSLVPYYNLKDSTSNFIIERVKNG